MEPFAKPEVIIIGAGISGLAAAQVLQNSGLVRVRVLEASERIGGRIHSSQIDDQLVELGAGWIHDSENNPLYTLAKEKSIPLRIGFNCQAYEHKNVKMLTQAKGTLKEPTPTLVDEVYAVYSRVFAQLKQIARKRALNGVNGVQMCQSVGEFVEQGMQSYLKEESEYSELKRSIFEWVMRCECHSCAVESLYRIDMLSFAEYTVDEENSFIISRGYNEFISCIFQDLGPNFVQFDSKVEKIAWCSSTTSRAPYRVSVSCVNGQTLAADHVIVTIPLGVLQMHPSLFEPPLPERKQSAIQRLGVGVLNRIFLVFERAFWSTEYEAFGILWPKISPTSGRRPNWVRELHVFHPIKKGSNVLMTWLSGKTAIEIESIDVEEIGKECVKVLQEFTGLDELPELLHTQKTCWYNDEFSKGSYTYIAVHSSGGDIDALAEPLPRHQGEAQCDGAPPLQVMFAGEATHRTVYGTTHGAYMSGVREANRIIEYLSK